MADAYSMFTIMDYPYLVEAKSHAQQSLGTKQGDEESHNLFSKI